LYPGEAGGARPGPGPGGGRPSGCGRGPAEAGGTTGCKRGQIDINSAAKKSLTKIDHVGGDEAEPAGAGEHERVEHADEGYGHAGVRH